ncbi:hypothetical protein DRN69_01730 [Candidatus Pacearchaeota archaeon]|nr:MAG: hypothetical protein DRN69_01730 [Candidatus Pacearchaeota archaeon]
MRQVEINGISLLNSHEKQIADKLLKEYYPKMQRQIKNIITLKIYIKEYKKEGKRKKYNIDVEIKSSGKIFKANASDWDFSRTLHKVLNKIINEIEHKLYPSEQH